VSASGQKERLKDRQHVIVLLRLLVNREGQVLQGEVRSVEDRQELRGGVRFRGPEGLVAAVRRLVARTDLDAGSWNTRPEKTER